MFSLFQQLLIPMTDFCVRSPLARPTQKKAMLGRYVLHTSDSVNQQLKVMHNSFVTFPQWLFASRCSKSLSPNPFMYVSLNWNRSPAVCQLLSEIMSFKPNQADNGVLFNGKQSKKKQMFQKRCYCAHSKPSELAKHLLTFVSLPLYQNH